MKSTFFRGASVAALVLTAGLWAQSANAATPTTTTSESEAGTEVSGVTVTGSFIAGTPENAALPVTVMTQDTIQKQGAPTIIELVKQLPESSGVIGESNQFVAGGRGQGQYGSGTINLRGLGPERTLVLFNGRRLPLAFGFAPDTITLPLSAIGRVEVLKDGAAATYGSDAIAGVVNFITKKHVNGFDVGGDFRWIQGSKGDWTLNGTWGHVFDNWDFMISGGYQHRSELDVLDRAWAHRRYDENPEGGWTGGGNPEAFTPAAPVGAGGTLLPIASARLDLGCTDLGGQLTTVPSPARPSPLLNWSSCRGQYSIWDALEEKQNSYQIYSELNVDLGGSHKLQVTGAYSYTDIPFFKSSPSYVTTRPVPITVLPSNYNAALLVPGTVPLASFLYFVPLTNPGFAAYAAAHPEQVPAGTTGAFLTVGTFRPYLTGGNPLYNYKHGVGGKYWHEQILLSAQLKGDITPDIHYDTSLSWGQYKYYGEGRDSLTDRLELALRGLGGPNCNFQTGTPGVGGCQYLNPFSNAIPGAPRNGLTNPGFVPALENTAALADWIMPIQWGRGNFRETEFDFTLSGKFPLTLPGGDMAWAAGVQLRRNQFSTDASIYGNSVLAPCADAALPGGAANCPANANPRSGPNVFGPVGNPVNLTQNIYAAYAELTVPILDNVNIDLAARYEDYGKFGGHTFNPQARGKWQVMDWFAVRGSVGTTFRAPPQGFLIPDPAINLQQVLGTFIPVASIGNPNLKPETALTWSVGGILETGGLHFTVDYWSYDFKKLLTVEPLGSVVSALFPNGTSLPNNCGSLDAAFVASHFLFSGPCGPTTVVGVNLQRINGPEIKTDGVDFNANYRFEDVMGGAVTVGGSATYVHKYQISAFSIGGVPILGFNAAGFFNSGTIAYPIPKWKGSAFINFDLGGFNIRWTARYTDSYREHSTTEANGYRDARANLFAFNAIYVTPTNPTGIVPGGTKISSIVLNDLAIRIPLPHNAVMTAAIMNIFDKDPPFARTDLNYDALTGDPLGRTIKLGLQAKF